MPFFRWDDMDQKNLAKPSDSKGSIIIGDHVTLNRSVSQPGRVARPHFHGCEQMLNVVQGSAKFRVGDEEKIITAGDIVHIPVGTEHEFTTLGDEEFVYLSFKNISEDWPPATALPDA
ncbi:MAG: cupin domain-containing protein [Alphaproteobacteria bacterium]|nr:cupin domain-containing protein [Alphaproteobacteria bacterium]